MSAKFEVGQIVYWYDFDLMRAEVLEVIERKFRKTKYRVKWIDENGHEEVHSEDKFVAYSSRWRNGKYLGLHKSPFEV